MTCIAAARRLSWPCDAGRPGCRELFPRSNCAQERRGRSDQGPAEPHGAYILKRRRSPLGVAARRTERWTLQLRQRCTTLDPLGDATPVVIQPAGEFRE